MKQHKILKVDRSGHITAPKEVERLIRLTCGGAFEGGHVDIDITLDEGLADGDHYFVDGGGGFDFCIRQYLATKVVKAIGREIHTTQEHFQAGVMVGTARWTDWPDDPDYYDIGEPELDVVRAVATALGECTKQGVLNNAWAILEAEEHNKTHKLLTTNSTGE